MAALLINTTFQVLALALIYSSFARASDAAASANPWLVLWKWLGDRRVVTVLLAGALANMAFAVLAGYVNPRDYVQDAVAARQFLKHETLYPENLPQLGVQELAAPIEGEEWLRKLPGVRRDFSTLKEEPAPGNAHPPLIGVLLAAPLEFLGMRGSFLLLVAICTALLWASMVKITRLLFGMPGPWPWLGLTGLIFGWYQVDTSLRGGQPATVILFLLVTVWALLREDRDVLAGMVLAVAAFLHAFPVLLGLWFLFRRRRAAISMTASLAVLAVAIGALTTPMVFAEWQKTISRISEVFVPILGNVSLAGLATSFLKGMEWNPHTREVSYLALGLILGLLAWFLFRNPQRASRQLMDLELAIFIGALLLASPISWPRYFPILLFPIAVYLKYAPTSQAVPQKATGLLWLLLCFALPGSGLGTVESWAQSHIGFPAAWLLAALPTVAVVTLVLWLYRTYSRMRAQAVQ